MLSIEEQNAIMNNAGSIVTFCMIFTKRFEVLLIKPGGNGGDLTSLGILSFPVILEWTRETYLGASKTCWP